MIESAIRSFLLSKTSISTAVGGRVYVGEFVPIKRNSKTVDTFEMPNIIIETDPTERVTNIDGSLQSMQFAKFDIVIKALQFSQAITIANLLAAAFRGISLGTSITLSDPPSAPILISISQVEILGTWNEDERDEGHGTTSKNRVIKLRVGWLEDVSTI